ncbi:MAG: hypothetical protein N3D16_05960 [Anaerolineales bacterium]|nr:hypothetical protein [Anaerolineales bacterium]
MVSEVQIGRLLSANSRQFLVGCHAAQINLPSLGDLTRVDLSDDYSVYGIITDISIADDGFVRQLATVEPIDEAIIRDHRLNRSVPLEIRVQTVGYRSGSRIYHLLPPQPPLGLDRMVLCASGEVVKFTSSGRFGYLRHLLQENSPLMIEVLAAHLQNTQIAHKQVGRADWCQQAIQEIITLLRDDYPTLIRVLHCLSDTHLFEPA